MNNILDFVRGIVRPLTTLILVFALVVVLVRIFWYVKIPDLPESVFVGFVAAFLSIVNSIVAFWFATRNNNSNGGLPPPP